MNKRFWKRRKSYWVIKSMADSTCKEHYLKHYHRKLLNVVYKNYNEQTWIMWYCKESVNSKVKLYKIFVNAKYKK